MELEAREAGRRLRGKSGMTGVSGVGQVYRRSRLRKSAGPSVKDSTSARTEDQKRESANNMS